MKIIAHGKSWYLWADRNPHAWLELWVYREHRCLFFDITIATYKVGFESAKLRHRKTFSYHYQITRRP